MNEDQKRLTYRQGHPVHNNQSLRSVGRRENACFPALFNVAEGAGTDSEKAKALPPLETRPAPGKNFAG
ncbi:hypothetical protein HG264_01720 [Pseudomonas sp. gcc21]|uniref:hypothetical protein n=1 Tax=Pseudomonas sp. gcc21 TaxID=2726989 RepID=UPI0014510AAA|nr:hypothetical protein [Pseudomonas sp. gcc21]QJD57411.1 hypothetical protein HG264_01720 [Pseudomonas sp. gcc21]